MARGLQTNAIWALAALALALAACTDEEPGGGAGPDAAAATVDAAVADPDPADAAPLPDAPAPEDTGDPELPLACELSEVTPIATCAFENCAEDIGDTTALALCLTLSCGSEFLSLSPECSQCVLAGLTGDLETAADKCVDGGGGGGGGGGGFPFP